MAAEEIVRVSADTSRRHLTRSSLSSLLREDTSLLGRLLGTDLLAPHVVVAALLLEQLIVGSLLVDGALVDDDDLVRVGDGRQTVTTMY